MHPTFYLPPEEWADNVVLTQQEACHLISVLRLKEGDRVRLIDGHGQSGQFVIEKIQNKNVTLAMVETHFSQRTKSFPIMALALSKSVRRGFFMEKAVELGAGAIWLWQAERSQGKVHPGIRDALIRQMIAGAKQCGNPWLPQIEIFNDGLTTMLKKAESVEHLILPWEHQGAENMLMEDMVGQEGETIYMIGPEGGFSEKELTALDQAGFIRVSLGPNILRCETAATLCLGIHWWASHLSEKSALRCYL